MRMNAGFLALPLALAASLTLPVATPATAAGQVHIDAHICTVRETLDSGGYTYIRCREGGSDVWLAVMQTRLEIGERISYHDTPPMLNFHSKGLDRSFPQIRFVPGISRASDGFLEGYDLPTDDGDREETDIYSGTDENGTAVFTDDPAKAVKGSKKK